MIELNITKVKDQNINEVVMSGTEHFLWIKRGNQQLCLFFDDAGKGKIEVDFWGEEEIIVNKI